MERDQREVVQILYRKGLDTTEKLFKATRIPKRSLRRYLARLRQGEGLERRVGSGRKSQFTRKEKLQFLQLAKYHPKWSSADIEAEAEKRGTPRRHRTTIYRLLINHGMRKWTPTPAPILTDCFCKKIYWL